MPEISIIVPVYKVEQYLSRCIDSILAQTFTDFELLLIDDGSPDNSGIICDEYAEKDRRILVFHKENGGVSSARNMGLDNAIGQYIMFCDSDDEVTPEWAGLLYNLIIKPNVCIGICNYSLIFNKTGTVKTRTLSFNPIVPPSEYFAIRQAQLDQYTVNKIFSRKIIDKYHLRFDGTMSYGEDAVFVLNYLDKCIGNFGISNSSAYYYYVENEGSLTNKYQENLWDCYEKILSSRENMFEKYAIDPMKAETRKSYAKMLAFSCKFALNNYLMESCRLQLRNKLKKIRQITGSKYYKIAIESEDFSSVNPIYRLIMQSGSPLLIIIYHSLSSLKHRNKGQKK